MYTSDNVSGDGLLDSLPASTWSLFLSLSFASSDLLFSPLSREAVEMREFPLDRASGLEGEVPPARRMLVAALTSLSTKKGRPILEEQVGQKSLE